MLQINKVKKVRPIIYKSDHALVQLTQGKFAKIDIDDAAHIGRFNWYFDARYLYANRPNHIHNRQPKTISMHRAIIKTKKGYQADHINGDGLDNRKSNLRNVTQAQNQHNRRKGKNCSSQYKGVCWDKNKKKWIAYIKFNSKRKHIGRFKLEANAAKAYDSLALKLFGEYACVNFK